MLSHREMEAVKVQASAYLLVALRAYSLSQGHNMSEARADKNAIFTQSVREQMMQPSLERIQQDLGFEIPVEDVPLPSRGLVYSPDSPLHNKSTVQIRAMVTKDEDILTNRSLIKKGTVITHLIQSCLMDKSVNVSDMIAGDRNALMIAIRITGYGSEYPVKLTCPKCEHEYDHTFDLASLPINMLEVEPAQPGRNVFKFELPVSKKIVHFKFIDGRDEEEIMATNENMKKAGAPAGQNLVTTRLQHAIVAIGDVTDRNKLGQYIRHMPARDSAALRKFMDKSEPGIEMKQDAECPSCQHSAEVNVPLGPTFFWPNAE